VQGTFTDSLEGLEAVLGVEAGRLRLGIGDDANAAQGVPLFQSKGQNMVK
jgi:hypothetical protein